MDTDTTGNIDVLTITANAVMDTITPNADLVDTLQAIGAGPDLDTHQNDTTTMADFTTSIEKVRSK